MNQTCSLPTDPPDTAMARLLWLSLTLFLSYLSVAMALPVVSIHVRHDIGLNDALGGLAVGISFASTIVTRNLAGRLADQKGGRVVMMRGLFVYTLASLVCLGSAVVTLPAVWSYTVLILGRLLLGLGESLAVVGMISWGLGVMGPQRSGRVISLMGMGMYGSFAAGGPLGLALSDAFGFSGLMVVCALLPLVGIAMSWPVAGVAPRAQGRRESFWRILGRIWRPGATVGLQGVGFAALGAFISLYFQDRGWPHAGWGLTGFGLGFVLMRLLCGHLPDRIGGTRVALASLVVEAVGQALLWQANGPWVALAGAVLTGLGCSMVFPAMGVEVVRRVPASQHGTAVGGFAAFQDLAYAGTGPVAGLFAGAFGYANVFLLGLAAALLGLWMAWQAHREPVLDV